jgi:hypothetical protein
MATSPARKVHLCNILMLHNQTLVIGHQMAMVRAALVVLIHPEVKISMDLALIPVTGKVCAPIQKVIAALDQTILRLVKDLVSEFDS